eukprot:12936099-Prorocentrum_lima.AAC.1
MRPTGWPNAACENSRGRSEFFGRARKNNLASRSLTTTLVFLGCRALRPTCFRDVGWELTV